MIIELGFRATDYQEIKKIEIVLTRPDVYKERLTNDLKTKILDKFLRKCNANISRNPVEKSGIFIGRGKARKDDPIKILWEENESCLGGIVGVLSGELRVTELSDLKEELTKCEIGERDILKINIQIQSRFDQVECAYFLSSLLVYSDVDINTNEYLVYESVEDIFHFLLVDLLRNKLKEAIQKGYYKSYCRIEANNDRVRGTLDVSRHIRLNMGQNNGSIAYSYRENSVNNPLNGLIVAAYDYLKAKYPKLIEQKIDSDLQLMGFLEEIRNEVTSCTQFNKLIMENIRPIAHPYFQEYELVRVICLQILRDEGVSWFAANEDEVNGFLYYLPDLWEDFLEKIFLDVVENEFKEIDIRVDAQKEVLYMGRSCRPDFVFYDKNSNDVALVVLDAKMKPDWAKQLTRKRPGKKDKAERNDMDKCIRDMAALNISRTGVVFPVKAKEDVKKDKVIYEIPSGEQDQDKTNCFYRIPFYIPDYTENTTYFEWKQLFQNAMYEFKLCFQKELLMKVKDDVNVNWLKQEISLLHKNGGVEAIKRICESIKASKHQK